MQAETGTPQYWRERAEQARTRAAGMTDPDAKRATLMAAENYDRLAQWAEEREAALRRLQRKGR